MTKMIMLMTAATISLGFAAQDLEAKPGPDRGPRASFEELDTNSDGQVTQAELAAHRAAQFTARDTDGDGVLSKEELTQAAEQARADRRVERRVDRMISRMDANDDGAISLDEMANPAPRRRGMMRMDANEDGVISKAEFDQASAGMADRMDRQGKRSQDR